MIVKTTLNEFKDGLAPQVEKVSIKGDGAAAFVYALNKGRAVEISQDNGGFWIEFWETSPR